jgi:protein-disulfide isomerase
VYSEYFSKGADPTTVPLYSLQGVKALGKVAGVDEPGFNKCIDEREMQQQVAEFTKNAQNNGINGTPYFTVNDTPIKGVPNYEILSAAIKSKL